MANTVNDSIIVTTRLPDLVKGQRMLQVRVPPVDNLDESLEIQQTQSQREDVQHGEYPLILIGRVSVTNLDI